MPIDATTSGPAAAAPVVLQVLPALNTGGVERGTVDIAEAIVEAGGTALVASEGGRLAHELQRAGAEHIAMPLASKNPLVMMQNVSRLRELIRARGVDIVHARSRAPDAAHTAGSAEGAVVLLVYTRRDPRAPDR